MLEAPLLVKVCVVARNVEAGHQGVIAVDHHVGAARGVGPGVRCRVGVGCHQKHGLPDSAGVGFVTDEGRGIGARLQSPIRNVSSDPVKLDAFEPNRADAATIVGNRDNEVALGQHDSSQAD